MEGGREEEFPLFVDSAFVLEKRIRLSRRRALCGHNDEDAGLSFLAFRYAFQTESNFYLATEFCEGGDLYHLLKRRRKTLSEDAARLISSEVILALESMHVKGCVYRDLKPDNVLLDSDGESLPLLSSLYLRRPL